MSAAEKINVTIPTIGESVSEGTIGKWFFKEGDLVQKDQPLLEIDSDKATLEVPASATGRLKILVPAGKTAAVGALVGIIEATEGEASKVVTKAPPSKESVTQAPAPSPAKSIQPTAEIPRVTEADTKGFSPSKRKLVRQGLLSTQNADNGIFDASLDGAQREPMSTIRKKIAARMIESQATTATLTTFNEVDMSVAMKLRSQLKEKFEARYGVKLGFMSLFSKAVIHALKTYPLVNARIEGDEIVHPNSVHLGIAVSTDRGLIVPVIKGAQNLICGDLERKIADLADRARTSKLGIAEMQGGTFTITNGGVFGSLLSTPIINPPQSGILGMHKIEHRPIAIQKGDGTWGVEVRPMMYIALSYDHRLIDGATSVGFLVKVKEYLEGLTEAEIL